MEGPISKYHGIENDVKFVELARFAVGEHNKQENAALNFVKVVKAKQQMVYNTLYFITLEAIDGDNKKNIYEATVWNVPWVKSRRLEDFKLIDGSPSPGSSMS